MLRWARKGLGQDKEPSANATSGVNNDWEEASAAYSPVTLKSLDLLDENLLNYDLLEALVVHVVETQARYGPDALLQVNFAAALLHNMTRYNKSCFRGCFACILVQLTHFMSGMLQGCLMTTLRP